MAIRKTHEENAMYVFVRIFSYVYPFSDTHFASVNTQGTRGVKVNANREFFR